MKAILFAALMLSAPAMARAAALPVKLADGATWTQTVVHKRTDERPGMPVESMTATTIVRETFHRGAGGPATVEQSYVSFGVDGVGAEQMAPLVAQAKAIYPATIETDDSLTPTRVRNWPQMQETIFKAMGAASADPKIMDGVRAMYSAMTDQQAASLFKEQSLVGLGQGVALEVGKPQPYEGNVPNLMGGPPIKTSGAFKLESYDGQASRAVVTWTQALDPQSTAASMKVAIGLLLQRVAPEKAAEAKAQFTDLTMERHDHCRYEIDVATGLASKADCVVTLKTGTASQAATRTEEWLITQSRPEAR
jgi:hypothetical protein